jgi:peptidoglycan/LPS O-acetylase OafA/YrhL
LREADGDESRELVVPAAAADGHAGAKIRSLESVRGIAAFLVVIHHVPAWNPDFYDIRIIRNCYLLVDVFFVLSGFVIYKAYADKIQTAAGLLRFQFLRLGRLYPVHLLFLMVFVLFEAAKYFAHSSYGVDMPNSAPFKESNLSAFIEQIFLVQAIGPTGNALTFNSPSWSISVEFYTYLIFGLTVLFARKSKHIVFCLLTVAALLLLINRTTFGSTDLLRCIAGYFLGCLVAAAAGSFKGRLSTGWSAAAFFALVIFLAVNRNPHLDSAVDLLSAVLILGLVCSSGGLMHAVLNWKVFTWLGTISYSIYMSHTAVMWTLNQVFRQALHKPVLFVGERMTPQLSLPETALSYVFAVLCVLAVSQCTYTFVEEPLRQKSRRLAAAGTSHQG